MHRPRLRALATLHQPRRPVAAGAPQPAALPAGVRIVDAPVEAFGAEAEGVGDPQYDHPAVLHRTEPVVEIRGGHRDVLAEAQRVVLVDPRVIARSAAVLLMTLQAVARIA